MTLATLVSPQWLHENLSAIDVKVIDASWYLPAAQRHTQEEYLAGHIPGAVFFDIDACTTPSPMPHCCLVLRRLPNMLVAWVLVIRTGLSCMTAMAYFQQHECGGCCACLGASRLLYWMVV